MPHSLHRLSPWATSKTSCDLRRVAWQILGALSGPWLAFDRLASRRLRVLGYHDVPNAGELRAQLDYLVDQFLPLRVDEVIPFLSGEIEVAKQPVWVTFDDGDPSVVEVGLPVLQEFSVPATMFVCPGVIDTNTPHWWQLVEQAADAGTETEDGPVGVDTVVRLKKERDETRREEVARIAMHFQTASGHETYRRQVTSDQLDEWQTAGNTVGNHTWDHPILDMCSVKEQERQIRSAHEWLADRLPVPPSVFAYPSGRWSRESEAVLDRLGYRVAVLFDHRIARRDPSLSVSRVRVNTSDSLDSFKARVSGLHPLLHRLRGGH